MSETNVFSKIRGFYFMTDEEVANELVKKEKILNDVLTELAKPNDDKENNMLNSIIGSIIEEQQNVKTERETIEIHLKKKELPLKKEELPLKKEEQPPDDKFPEDTDPEDWKKIPVGYRIIEKELVGGGEWSVWKGLTHDLYIADENAMSDPKQRFDDEEYLHNGHNLYIHKETGKIIFKSPWRRQNDRSNFNTEKDKIIEAIQTPFLKVSKIKEHVYKLDPDVLAALGDMGFEGKKSEINFKNILENDTEYFNIHGKGNWKKVYIFMVTYLIKVFEDTYEDITGNKLSYPIKGKKAHEYELPFPGIIVDSYEAKDIPIKGEEKDPTGGFEFKVTTPAGIKVNLADSKSSWKKAKEATGEKKTQPQPTDDSKINFKFFGYNLEIINKDKLSQKWESILDDERRKNLSVMQGYYYESLKEWRGTRGGVWGWNNLLMDILYRNNTEDICVPHINNIHLSSKKIKNWKKYKLNKKQLETWNKESLSAMEKQDLTTFETIMYSIIRCYGDDREGKKRDGYNSVYIDLTVDGIVYLDGMQPVLHADHLYIDLERAKGEGNTINLFLVDPNGVPNTWREYMEHEDDGKWYDPRSLRHEIKKKTKPFLIWSKLRFLSNTVDKIQKYFNENKKVINGFFKEVHGKDEIKIVVQPLLNDGIHGNINRYGDLVRSGLCASINNMIFLFHTFFNKYINKIDKNKIFNALPEKKKDWYKEEINITRDMITRIIYLGTSERDYDAHAKLLEDDNTNVDLWMAEYKPPTSICNGLFIKLLWAYYNTMIEIREKYYYNINKFYKEYIRRSSNAKFSKIFDKGGFQQKIFKGKDFPSKEEMDPRNLKKDIKNKLYLFYKNIKKHIEASEFVKASEALDRHQIDLMTERTLDVDSTDDDKFNDWDVKDLKDALKKARLDFRGKKEELISRLRESARKIDMSHYTNEDIINIYKEMRKNTKNKQKEQIEKIHG